MMFALSLEQFLLPPLFFVLATLNPCGSTSANEVAQVSERWNGNTVNDLFKEYKNIFKHGNRNAASHLWANFLLARSSQMTHEKLTYMFSGFCAVSGSPIRPSDYNRYKLNLDRVDGSGKMNGFMNYCCWPCVCDTQDFIRVDTRNVSTADGERTYHFVVIGNPCDSPEELTRPFDDAFGRGRSTLQQDAAEVRCEGGVLQDAPLSDHGYVIINMFFDYPVAAETDGSEVSLRNEQPGRISEVAGVKYQDEDEYASMCLERKKNGYNSGMGEIFRRVAGISPIVIPSGKQLLEPPDLGAACSDSADPAACTASSRSEL